MSRSTNIDNYKQLFDIMEKECTDFHDEDNESEE